MHHGKSERRQQSVGRTHIILRFDGRETLVLAVNVEIVICRRHSGVPDSDSMDARVCAANAALAVIDVEKTTDNAVQDGAEQISCSGVMRCTMTGGCLDG